jgi:hypothetical protein
VTILFKVKDRASQFQNFPMNFHKFHALFSMRLSLIGYAATSFAQDCFRKYSWVHTTLKRMASGLTFLERYHNDGDELLDYIAQVTGNET